MKHTKAELLKNHYDSKKFDCHDKLEIELVDLLLKEHKQLLLEKTAYKKSGLSPERVQELAKAEAEGRLVVLPCKVGDLLDKYRELTRPKGDEAETYTTGYQNGHRNGQAELLAYLLQIDTGVREAAEKALGGSDGSSKDE